MTVTAPAQSAHLPRGKLRLMAAAGLSLVLVAMAVEICWNGIVAYYAVENPAVALRLSPLNAAAIINTADDRFQNARETKQPIDTKSMQSAVERALVSDPLNAAGVRLIGQLDEGPTAEKFMERAVELSKREAVAVGWLADYKRIGHDYAGSLVYVDLLLRGQPSYVPVLADILTVMMEVPATRQATFDILTSNPPWAAQFLPLAMQRVHDPETVVALSTQFQSRGGVMAADVSSGYVHRLVTEAKYDLAYETWRHLLTPTELDALRVLYNGDFRFAPTGGEFDWALWGGQNVTISTSALTITDTTKALKLDYNGGLTSAHSVLQGFRVPPGKYKLSGKVNGNLRGRRGHEWRVMCFTTGAVIGQSPVIHGSVSGWQDFSFTFAVPEKDCSLQRVQLTLDTRSVTDKFVSGIIMYRQLAISTE